MPKIQVSTEEWYPVWEIINRPSSDTPIEVDDDTLARWRRVFEEFKAVQAEIEAVWNAMNQRSEKLQELPPSSGN